MKGRQLKVVSTLLGLACLQGCGGGGGDNDSPSPTTPPLANEPITTSASSRAPAGSGSTICPVCESPQTGDSPVAPPPGPPVPGEQIGVFPGYGGIFGWDNSGGDGGVGGGGDGGGGVGAGGGLGRFSQARVTVTLDDNRVLGPAFTDERGLVTIKPGRNYKGGLKIEMVGAAGTNYYDEAKKSDITFPEGERLRVHVDKIRGNIGITPLTEAAVQFQSAPELADKSPVEKIRRANEQILQQINGHLPDKYLIIDITRLPVLVAPTSITAKTEFNTLNTTTPQGRYGSVLAALTISGGQFNTALPNPGVTTSQQLVTDLADGRLDAASTTKPPPGSPPPASTPPAPQPVALAPANKLTYKLDTFSSNLINAADTANAEFGTAGGGDGAASPVRVSQGTFMPAANSTAQREAVLQSNGQVMSGTTVLALPGSTTRATALFSDGVAMFIRREDGSMEVLGRNNLIASDGFFRFGDVTPAATDVPIAAPAILSGANGATDIQLGPEHAVARRVDGSVLTWGGNVNEQGIPITRSPSPSQPVEGRITPAAVNLNGEAKAVEATNFSSLVLTNDNTVVSWGDTAYTGQGPAPAAATPQLPGSVLTAPNTPLRNITALAATSSAAFAIQSDGSVWGWGDDKGRLVRTAAAGSGFAEPIAGLKGIRKIAQTRSGLVALDNAGELWYWGYATEDGGEPVVAPKRVTGISVKIRDIFETNGGAGNTRAVGVGDQEFNVVAPGVAVTGNDPVTPPTPTPVTPPTLTPVTPVPTPIPVVPTPTPMPTPTPITPAPAPITPAPVPPAPAPITPAPSPITPAPAPITPAPAPITPAPAPPAPAPTTPPAPITPAPTPITPAPAPINTDAT